MDAVISSARIKCSHDGCEINVPYLELADTCGFFGQPLELLGHLAALHSVPVHKVHYGKVHQLQVSEPRYLLHGVGDNCVFLLAVDAYGAATVVSVVCIRAGASPSPQYAVKLWANGPPPPSSAAGRIKWELEAVTSSTRPGEVVVEELPSFMMLPPAYMAGSGPSKEVILDIRIEKM